MFRVGDMIRVRDWDDMVAEFGLDGGDISCPGFCFASGMKKYCGRIFQISKFNRIAGMHEIIFTEGTDNWHFSRHMIELPPEYIAEEELFAILKQ